MNYHRIRQQLRQQRRQLPPLQQTRASQSLARHLSSHPIFLRSNRIGGYLVNDGEIDPSLVMAIAEAARKKCFLPALHPLKYNRLYFVQHRTGDDLSINRFGIEEPSLRDNCITPAWALNVILLPLVAFDRQGNRLGMGSGFYDRTLAFIRRFNTATPCLIGLAHSFQELDSIPSEPWDIPLDAIATEEGIIETSQRQADHQAINTPSSPNHA